MIKKISVTDTMAIKLIETSEYISLEETLSVLNIMPNTLETMFSKKHKDNYFIRYFVCPTIKINVCKTNRRYFNKSDIEHLKEKQIEFISTHISIQESRIRYANYFENHLIYMKDHIESYTLPLYAKTIDFISSNINVFKVYKISEIEKCIYELNKLQVEKEQNQIYYNSIKIEQYIENGNELFVSIKDALSILETTKDALRTFNISSISTGNGHAKYYNYNEILNLINKVEVYFNQYYTIRQVKLLLPESYYRKKLQKIFIPKIYRQILINTLHEGNLPSEIAFDKDDVNNWLQKIEEKEVKNKEKKESIEKSKNNIDENPTIKLIESGQYITQKEASLILDIQESTFEKMVNVKYKKLYPINFFIGEVYKANVSRTGTNYYCKSDIEKLKVEQRDFIKNHILPHVARNTILNGCTLTSIRTLNLYEIPLFARSKNFTNFNQGCKKAYKIIELKEYIKNAKFLDKNKRKTKEELDADLYFSKSEVCNLLEIPGQNVIKIMNRANINSTFFGKHPYYLKEEVNKFISSAKSFFEKHYSTSKVKELLSSHNYSLLKKQIKGITVPVEYNQISNASFPNFKNKSKIAYEKTAVDNFIKIQEEIKNDITYHKRKKEFDSSIIIYHTLNKSNENLNNNISTIDGNNLPIFIQDQNKIILNNKIYISKKDVLNILNINKIILSTLVKNEDIDVFQPKYSIQNTILKKAIYYNENDILSLKDKQNEFIQSYILVDDAIDKYSNRIPKYVLLKNIKKNCIPLYAHTEQLKLAHPNLKIFNQKFYNKSDIENYICNYDNKYYKIPTRIYGRSSFETFQLRLAYIPNWNGFEKESAFTENLWFNYVENFLKSSVSKNNTLNNVINGFVRDTPRIREILDRYSVSEIYLLSSNKINLFLKSLPAQNYKKSIYQFLQYYYAEMSYLKPSGMKCLYRMGDIENPNYSYENEIDDSKDIIYDFETYCKVFNYETDIELHVSTSLNEIFSLCTATYLSTWLYVMLHLNNAWRHGDVVNFPVLSNIEELLIDTNINGFDWFKNNKIDLPLARAVIQRIRSWEMIISKTQIKGVFFCSDELAPALSTSILMLTLYKQKFGVLNENHLMNFDNSSNEVSQRLLKIFFKKLGNFKFYSRKFNKTIMTFLFYLSNISGDSNALLYAQEIRKHKDSNSTLHYLNFDTKAIETLSKQLFQRGEFGYIPSMLVQIINHSKTDSFEILTEQSSYLKEILGGIPKINSTVGFLNAIRYEHTLVVSTLNSMSFDDLQKCLTNIYTESMPAPDDESLMCLFSNNGCQNIDSKCFECPFHIPTIYTLSLLCDSISKDIKTYNTSTNEASEYKLALSIIKKKTTLAQAIKQFGKDYVYGCLGMPKDDFINELITFNISSRNNFNME